MRVRQTAVAGPRARIKARYQTEQACRGLLALSFLTKPEPVRNLRTEMGSKNNRDCGGSGIRKFIAPVSMLEFSDRADTGKAPL